MMFKKMKSIFLFYALFLGHLLVDVMIHFCTADLKCGYSLLQRGHRLEKRLITNLGGISFLGCVEECLRTTRCLSVNYFQPAHFCEVNYKSKESFPQLYLAKAGWYYSERNDWYKAMVGPCSDRSCQINEKCVPKAFGDIKCEISDCGAPMNEGVSFENVQDGDAIGVNRKMHITCLERYERQGSEMFICQPDGVWKSDLKCKRRYESIGCYEDSFQSRVLEFGPRLLVRNGRSHCATFCSTQGSFQYFGLQVGTECFCGNEINYNSQLTPLDDCKERTCFNNPAETCGGACRIEAFLM